MDITDGEIEKQPPRWGRHTEGGDRAFLITSRSILVHIPGTVLLGNVGKIGKFGMKGLTKYPFKGKTLSVALTVMKNKGYEVKFLGTEGRASLVNPKTGRQYYIDPGTTFNEPAHVDIFYNDSYFKTHGIEKIRSWLE